MDEGVGRAGVLEQYEFNLTSIHKRRHPRGQSCARSSTRSSSRIQNPRDIIDGFDSVAIPAGSTAAAIGGAGGGRG